MNSNLNSLLQEYDEKKAAADKQVTVHKDVDLNYDLGHLLASDTNPLNLVELRSNADLYLKQLSRDNCQLIVNKLWSLETKHVNNFEIVVLPKPETLLPRTKPIPKPKPPTKWELFAKAKGIQKKKKEKAVWDDVSKSWKPRFGYKSINSGKDDWLIEVPQNNTDPNVDMFSKKKEEKKERVAKNELKRLRNIARAQKLKLPGNSGVLPKLSETKEELSKVVNFAKTSTASLGKFEETIKNEKPAKRMKKRKYDDNFGDVSVETEKNLQIFDKLHNKGPELDIKKAVNSLISTEEKERAEDNKKNPKKVKSRKAGKRRSNNERRNFKGKKGKDRKSSNFKGKGKGRNNRSKTTNRFHKKK